MHALLGLRYTFVHSNDQLFNVRKENIAYCIRRLYHTVLFILNWNIDMNIYVLIAYFVVY